VEVNVIASTLEAGLIMFVSVVTRAFYLNGAIVPGVTELVLNRRVLLKQPVHIIIPDVNTVMGN
jgi:hypothetical protein